MEVYNHYCWNFPTENIEQRLFIGSSEARCSELKEEQEGIGVRSAKVTYRGLIKEFEDEDTLWITW